MATAKFLFVSAALLVCGVAAVDKTVNPSPTVPHATSTTKGPAPKPTSTPTPLPATAMYNFSNITGNLSCMVRLDGVMDWNITYNTTKNTVGIVRELVNGTATVDKDNSSCVYKKSALLVLTWNGKDNETRTLTFNFTAGNTKRNMHWKLENVTLHFTVSGDLFPSYPPHQNTTGSLFSDKFIDSDNNKVEYQRSYQCSSSRLLAFSNMTVIDLDVTVNITGFRIQAFEFKDPNSTKSAFGNARSCPTDATGKKIVPIAVGIALGVLIIAVIIAFVISKIVNRKKSGYEALN